MANTPSVGTTQKTTHIRRRGDMSPLAAKRQRLDNAITARRDHEVSTDDTAALDGCIRMMPADFDIGESASTQQLAPELEPLLFTSSHDHLFTEPAANEPFMMQWSSDDSGTEFPQPNLPSASFGDSGGKLPNIPVSSTPLMLTLPSLPGDLGPSPSEGLQASLASLEARSHAVRLAKVKLEQKDKSTSVTYGRHINRYEKWWAMDQIEYAKLHPGWTRIPAFPITPAKACVFLEHESTREKVMLFLLSPVSVEAHARPWTSLLA